MRMSGWLVILLMAMGRAEIASAEDESADRREFVRLRDDYVAKFRPLFIKSARAWWDANTTGADEAFAARRAAEEAIVELRSDRKVFGRLKALRQAGRITDPVLARELDVMYRSFVPGQADPALQKKIIALESAVEQEFNAHRGEVDGKALSENDIRAILSESRDSKAVEKAWKAYMEVGRKIEPRLRELVALRNELARSLGFRNYYVMRLTLDEVDEAELIRLFDELDVLTREPFAALKQGIDAARAARFDLRPEALRPWHFGDLFFQEAPPAGDGPDLDEVYKDKDLLALAKDYYGSLGMSIDDILARSDLYEKPRKSPHAFSTCIDREQDVRVLCNLKNNLFWADTSLHELGHAVYDKYIAREVPFLLHEPAHSLTTEGYAMMMGSMAKNEDYLVRVVKLSPDRARDCAAAARRHLRAEKLIFSRWAQVMVRFEQGMYETPQEDLGRLWWDLKRRYQLLNPPESLGRPDYAAKIHIVTAPVYYHSYMMGDLFGCQVQNKIARDVLKLDDPAKTSFYGSRAAGEFMRREIFEPGNLHSWNVLTKRATGEPLTARYFARMYVAK